VNAFVSEVLIKTVLRGRFLFLEGLLEKWWTIQNKFRSVGNIYLLLD
jgi:hypothetical protein